MTWPYSNKTSGTKGFKDKGNQEIKAAGASKKPTKDPMEGVTLKMILERLEAKYGWDELAGRIRINCFAKDPSIKSSLKFLRRMPWARAKVEALYLESDWTT